MPSFKLNGRAAEFRPGEMVLEAAARAGVPVPYYCYHPDLSRPANCRMCLVEMVGAPKLITACSWPANEKMEILTDSPRVKAARANVMEFLLVNHPLDCPICDQAGECKLQQYAYLFGKPSSSLEEEKVHLEKRKVLGPHVVLDQERCISCTRCVRFTQEVTGTRELTMVARTSHQTVDIHPGRQLDNAYSGNVVDMCPVGALTLREFRFEARVWYLQATDTTCTLCSRGCNVTADWRGERTGLPEVKRVRARRNPAVNGAWICDEGRLALELVQATDRPVRATGGEPEAAAGSQGALDAALAAAATALRSVSGSPGALGVLASGSETCEELAAVAALARAFDRSAELVVLRVDDGPEDAILRRKDKSANQRGARLLGYGGDAGKLAACKVVLLVDADLRADGGLEAHGLKALARGARGVALAARRRPWLRSCEAFLPLANAFEKAGTIVNCDGDVQRLATCVPAPGDCRPAHGHASAIAAAAGLPSLPVDAETWLARICASGGPLAPLDPAKLGQWGARLPARAGEAVAYHEEPPAFFASAPQSFAEGEYSSFIDAVVSPPAVHVAAGAPSGMHAPAGGGTGGFEVEGPAATPPAPAGGGAR